MALTDYSFNCLLVLLRKVKEQSAEECEPERILDLLGILKIILYGQAISSCESLQYHLDV